MAAWGSTQSPASTSISKVAKLFLSILRQSVLGVHFHVIFLFLTGLRHHKRTPRAQESGMVPTYPCRKSSGPTKAITGWFWQAEPASFIRNNSVCSPHCWANLTFVLAGSPFAPHDKATGPIKWQQKLFNRGQDLFRVNLLMDYTVSSTATQSQSMLLMSRDLERQKGIIFTFRLFLETFFGHRRWIRISFSS